VSGENVPPMLTGVAYHCAAVDDTQFRMYIIGGVLDLATNVTTTTVQYFDPLLNAWSNADSLTTGLRMHSCGQ
jgi:hypothetical protein